MSSIGQYAVQATPMQMAQVAQTIANGGQMMAPYLIKQIVDADNQTMRKTKPTDAVDRSPPTRPRSSPA